jgi:hypothetical protein
MIWGFFGWQAVIIIVTLILAGGGAFWILAYTTLNIVRTIQNNKKDNGNK